MHCYRFFNRLNNRLYIECVGKIMAYNCIKHLTVLRPTL